MNRDFMWELIVLVVGSVLLIIGGINTIKDRNAPARFMVADWEPKGFFSVFAGIVFIILGLVFLVHAVSFWLH